MGNKTSSTISEAAAIYASASLSDALFTTTRQRVLGCLFGQPDRSFTGGVEVRCLLSQA